MFSTVYVNILEQLLMPKILYFFVFKACHKHPFPRSFTNLLSRSLLFLGLNIPDYKIFRNEFIGTVTISTPAKNKLIIIIIIIIIIMQYKILPKTFYTVKQDSLFFFLWFSFQCSFFICFFSNVLLHTCVHSD